MINATSLSHPTMLAKLADAMANARDNGATIIYNRNGQNSISVVYVGGQYKIASFTKGGMITDTVKKVFKSVDSVRFNALSFLL